MQPTNFEVLVMTGLADVDGFKIQVCMWPDVWQLGISIHKT